MEEENKPVENINNEQNNNKNGMSIASMVLGIVGLIVAALPCGILAIIFATIARKKGKNGMSTAGLVLGIIDVATGVLFIILGTAGIMSLF